MKGLYEEYFCIVRLTRSRWSFFSSAWHWVGFVSNDIMGLIWDTVASFIGYFCAGNWFVVVTSIVKILTMSARRAPGYPHCSSLLPLLLASPFSLPGFKPRGAEYESVYYRINDTRPT